MRSLRRDEKATPGGVASTSFSRQLPSPLRRNAIAAHVPGTYLRVARVVPVLLIEVLAVRRLTARRFALLFALRTDFVVVVRDEDRCCRATDDDVAGTSRTIG